MHFIEIIVCLLLNIKTYNKERSFIKSLFLLIKSNIFVIIYIRIEMRVYSKW